MVLGETGVGKSHSLKSLKPEETFVIQAIRKDLPWKGSRKQYKPFSWIKDESGVVVGAEGNVFASRDYDAIKQMIALIDKGQTVKNLVLDDIIFCMTGENMDKAMIKGYDKYTEIGSNFATLFLDLAELKRDDLNVIVLSHSTQEGDREEMMLTGKMIKEKFNIVGMMTTVLKSIKRVNGDEEYYAFTTRNSGYDFVKSPEGMFPSKEIPNDMAEVLNCMDKYYNED